MKMKENIFPTMDGSKGSLELNNEVVNAKYLLLRRNGEEFASDLYEIKSKGPVFSNVHLDSLNYPASNNPKEYYLSIEIEKVKAPEFKDVCFNFKELMLVILKFKNRKNIYSKVGLPFTVTLTELMNKKIKICKIVL